MMRKRILACILAAAMTLGSLPVSAAEISHEGETENASIEFSVEEAAIEETLVEETSMKETSIEETFIEETFIEETFIEETATKETSIEETLVEETSMKETSIEETLVEETSMKETRTESEATETAAPKEEETEERPMESEAQSEEEANSTERASETETTGESETTQEDESMESESASEELSSETDYEEHPNGLLPFEIGGTDIFAGLNTSLYTRGIENRAKYDPRVDAPEEMTSVKDQGQWGTCWAHGAMACLENAMIRQGLADNTIDLSERHLAYFAKHTGIDKLENANDDTIIVTPENKTVRGGSIHLAAIKLMNWHGAASEEKYPYYPDPKMWDRMVVSQSDAQDMEAMAHDIYFIPTGNASKKESITAMKKLIAEYGCVEVGYEHKGEYYNNDTFAYYDPNPGGGHAVTVVGWDDNFPIEKFGKYKPSNNGAWITKNSWGEGFGDGGYFYISYDDVSLDSGNIESVIVAADKNEYDNNYFYGNTNSYSAKWSYGKAAQVYKVKSGVNSEKLSAVSVMLYSEKAEYSIQVYKNPKLVNGVVEDPESGTAMLKEPVTGKTGYAGLYTIDLPEPVIFSKGDLMSIVFTFSGNVRVYADQSGMSESKDENGNVDSTTKWTNTTHAGQSFYKNGSTWKDAHDQEFNFRINALTQDYIYRVTFLDAKGNKISEQIVDGGKDAVPPTPPEREGYTFKGWSGNYQNISRNTKLTAKYEPTPYSITYELNGGMLETDNPSSYTIETDTISLEEPLRRGHFFAGWYEQNDFSGTSIDTIQKGSIGNKTLYAKWEEDSANSTKPVLFPQEGIIEEGETIIIRAPKDADIYYTLDGTAPTIENGIKYTGPFTISKDMTIKAVSARNEELSAVTEASYQYYALRLALAEETTDCFKMRSKKLKLTQIPTTKSESDVTWTTSNQFIVTVSKDGTITGVAVGTATITAKTKNSKGDEVTASCRVTVKDNGDIAAGRYKNIVWYIDSTGKLVVTGTGEFLVDPSGGMGNDTESETGTGELADASSEKRPPWYNYRGRIRSAEIRVTDITNISRMFYNYDNLTKVDLSGFKTDQVTDMSYMFWGCNNLTEVNLSGFKTDQVIDMSYMFWGCSNLTNLDVSGFKTGRVTDMSHMFQNCSNLTNLDVSGFKTDRVTNMDSMFWGCSNLTNLDVSGFKTDQVTNMSCMFWYCTKLTNLDVSGFKTDQVTDVNSMFINCNELTELNLSSFDLSNVTEKFKANMLPYDRNSKLRTIQTPRNLKQSVSLLVKDTDYAWCKPDGTVITELPQNMSESILITQKLGGTNRDITWEIDGDGKLTVTGTGDLGYASYNRARWYKYRESVKSATVNVTGMTDASYLFYECSNLTDVDLSGFQMDQITDVTLMFSDCSSLQTIQTPCNLKLSVSLPVKGNNYAWYKPDGTTITKLPQNMSESILITQKLGGTNQNITWQIDEDGKLTVTLLTPKPYKGGIYQGITWEIDENGKLTVTGTGDFSAGTGPGRAPWYRYREEILTAEIKVTGITNTSYMFYDCTSLTEVDVSGLKTDQVTDMFCMFGICNSLTKLDVSGFKTDQVTDMSSMFFECDSLTNLDVSGFNTDQVTDMSAMFCSCDSLTNLDISGFNTDQVTDMSAMFSSCGSLTNLDVSGFKTDCATDMEGMFSNCGSLTNLNVSGFKTDQVSDMRNMFYGCGSLTNLDVSGFKTDRVTDMEGMFENCGSLTNLDVSGFKTDQVSDMRNMFYGCNELTDLNLGSFELSNADWTYRMLPNSNRSKLQTIQTPRNVKDSVELPEKTDYVWCKPDGTILTELPQNLSESILITWKPFVGGTYQNITWEIDENGKLTVTGTGEYSDSTSYNRAPWYAHRSEIASAEIKVTGMTDASYLFYGCSNLKEVDLSGFDTDTLTNMSYLFGNCGSLTSLDLSGFDMQTIAKASNMLNNCNQLSKITAPRNLNRIVWLPGGDDDIWYLPNKTTTTLLPRNLSYSVALAKNEVPDVPDTEIGGSYGNMTWRLDAEGNLTVEGTGEVTNVSGQNRAPWHDYANDIKSAKMNMTGMTDMSYLFDGCANLTSLDLSGFDAADVTNTTDILQGCTKLTTIHTPCNLKCAIALSANEDEAWYQEDETAVTELPQNLDHSILLTKTAKSEKPTPPLEETVYKVTFDLQGHGAQIAAIEVKEGSKISEPSRPEAEGYDFTGWYKEKACKTLWNFAKDTVEADTTLYAGWKKKSSGNIGDSEDTKESDIQIVGLAKSYQYTGGKIIPAFDVIDYDIAGGKLLAPGVDYTVTYKNNKEPGTAYIIVKGKGNYAAVKGYEAIATFAIVNAQDAGETPLANIKGAKITGGLSDVEYNGAPHIPQTITLTLKDKITTISYTYNANTEKYEKAGGKEPMDVNIAVSNNTNKGTANVLVTGVDDRGKTVKIKGKFKITPIDLSLKPVTIKPGNAIYSPKGAVPETLNVTCEGKELEPGRDYTVKYAGNKTVGTGTITITGKGNYTKKAQPQYYSITAADMSGFQIAAVTANERTKAGKIKATIVDETGNALKPKQYTLEVYPATTAEDGTVTVGPERYNDTQELAAGQTIHVVAMAIDGTNLVAGTTTAADFMVGMDISKAKFTLTPAAKKGIAYTGSEIKLEEKHFASVTYQGRGALHMKREDGTGDYEIVSYTNNVNKGTATAVIRGINAYSGTKTIKFKIAQKEIKNIKLSEVSKQILEQFSASRYLRY